MDKDAEEFKYLFREETWDEVLAASNEPKLLLIPSGTHLLTNVNTAFALKGTHVKYI
jgi:hypothetical protein